MSQKTNNRPKVFESKSLKGPKRKLELIVENGKRYIKKSDLQHYFFDQKWKIDDFQYYFGIGHRIVRGSLHKWFTAEEIDASHREKIAYKQRGENNSNRVNWYRPRKLIPLFEIEDAVSQSTGVKDLQKKLGLTPWELSSIQQFYNFRLPSKSLLCDRHIQHRLTKNEIKILCKVITGMGWEREFFENTPQAIYNLDSLMWTLRKISRSLKKAFRDEIRESPVSFPSNLLEYNFHIALNKMGIEHQMQFYIPQHHLHLDFLLQGKYDLELDGRMHNPEQDRIRDEIVSSLGYKIIRIDIDRLDLNRYSKTREVIKCLKKLVLPKLSQ